jgi:VWFA-related protein
MRTRLSTIACIVVAVATSAAQSGPEPRDPQQPVFRTESNYIRVDMYPTRDGEFVTDLRPEEVEVYEDGVRQRVETFEYVHIGQAAAEGRRPDARGEAAESDESRARVFVVFIDTHTTTLEREGELRLSLVRFLDRLLGPDDLVGLMTPNMSAAAVTLGRRTTVISDLANDERWTRRIVPERQDLERFAWENCYPSRGGSPGRVAEMTARRDAVTTITALQELVGHLRDLREERKAVLVVTAGWPFEDDSALLTGGRNETEACASDREALARLNYGSRLKELAKAANRANVSFYPVNSRRPVEPPRELRESTRAFIRQRDKRASETVEHQLRGLAEQTDGFPEASPRNLVAVTQRIIDDTSSYYLLGYQSTNSRLDGRFRTIAVRVNRPGVRVRARQGYGGETPRVLTTAPIPAAPPVDSRVSSALVSVDRFDAAAPMWLRASSWTPSEAGPGGAFWFVGELAAQTRSQPRWTAGATADVVVVAPDKTQVLSRSIDLGPADTAFSLRIPDEGALSPGDYSVRVRLRPARDDNVAVNDSARVVLDADSQGLGEAVIWRKGPSPRSEYLRTADPRFRRNERLRLELPTGSSEAALARVLDRRGQPLQIPAQVSDRGDGPSGLRWIVVDAPLAGMAPGDYAIEVTQDGIAQVTAFRLVP